MHRLAPSVRKILVDECRAVPDERVGIFLSGGIDSSVVLFALLEAGKKVTGYTFMLDGRLSTDFKFARHTAKTFGVDFVPIFLPTSLDILKRDLVRLANLGARLKTEFECFWPMLYAYESTKERVIFNGNGVNGHFGIGKKAMMHYRDRMDDYRRMCHASPTRNQMHLHRKFAASLGKEFASPFRSKPMQDLFLGTSWKEINSPKLKQPMYDAFPRETARIRTQHMNYQLGDSGIQTNMLRLLHSDWNTSGWKSTVGIYNAVVAGRLRL
jgi:asparagine synthetase B (glutamine-hydrolysing)